MQATETGNERHDLLDAVLLRSQSDQIEAQILAQAHTLIELEEQLDTLRAQEHNESGEE